METQCHSCKYEIFDNDFYCPNGTDYYCETCWDKLVCNICYKIDNKENYYYCVKCMKNISSYCKCISISALNYHGVICCKCVTKNKYFCDLCKTDLYKDLKNKKISICERKTYYNIEEYNGKKCFNCFQKEYMI